jgi:tRNA(Ile)-lysidine synthase
VGPHPATADIRRAVDAALADLAPGDTVLVACSGGADSLALAAALAFVAPHRGLLGGGVTVDHGLQAGSAERAAAVAKTLAGLGLDPVEVAAVDVGTTGGPEAAARAARYAALDAAAARHGAAAVLLGHTRDDQAETVLLGLARGSGARSLAGMAPVSGRYRRPFLELGRDRVLAACAAADLTPWTDPHNAEAAYARPRVRHEALPALERALGPGVAEALARTARLLRADADALDQWAWRAGAECADADGWDCARLAALPAAVRSRVLRSAALDAGCPGTDLSAVHVTAVDELVVAWRGQLGVDLPGRVGATRRCGRLTFTRRRTEVP